VFQQLFFQSPILSDGEHTLTHHQPWALACCGSTTFSTHHPHLNPSRPRLPHRTPLVIAHAPSSTLTVTPSKKPVITAPTPRAIVDEQ
jgi:hypothetical protein